VAASVSGAPAALALCSGALYAHSLRFIEHAQSPQAA